MLNSKLLSLEESFIPNYASKSTVTLDNFNAYRKVLCAYACRLASASTNRQSFLDQISVLISNSQYFSEFRLIEDLSHSNSGSKEKPIFINPKCVAYTLKPTIPFSSAEVSQWIDALIQELSENYLMVQEKSIDGITQLFSQEHFFESMHHRFQKIDTWKEQKRYPTKAVFLNINLPFAWINDSYGHDAGNQVLGEMKNLLMNFRIYLHEQYQIPFSSISIHRQGGPNFTISIFLPNNESLGTLHYPKLAASLHQQLSEHDWKIKTSDLAKAESAAQALPEFVIDLNESIHYSKSDPLKKNGLKGMKFNIGVLPYQPIGNEIKTSQIIERILDNLFYLNLSNDGSPQISDCLNQNSDEPDMGIEFLSTDYKTFFYELQRRAVKPDQALLAFEAKVQEDQPENLLEHITDFFKEEIKSISSISIINPESNKPDEKFGTRWKNIYKVQFVENETKRTFLVPIYRDGKIFRLVQIATEDKNFSISSFKKLVRYIRYMDVIFEKHQFLSFEDLKTKLPNDKKMILDLDKKIHEKKPTSLTMCDFNKFGGFSLTFGKNVGDKIIERIGEEFRKNSQEAGVQVYRYGGEEFIWMSDQLKNNKAFYDKTLSVFSSLNQSDHFLVSLSWHKIEERLVLQNLSQLKIDEIKKSFFSEVKRIYPHEREPDELGYYNVNPLRIKRFTPKSEYLMTGLSFIAGTRTFRLNHGDKLWTSKDLLLMTGGAMEFSKSLSDSKGGGENEWYEDENDPTQDIR